MYDQAWPHPNDPTYSSTVSNYRKTQQFNTRVKSVMNFNKPAAPHKGFVHIQEKCTELLNYPQNI